MAKEVDPPRNVGHFVKEWRDYRGFTLEGLAEQAGITHSAIQQIEAGTTKYRQVTLEKLAPILKTTPGALIDTDPKTLKDTSEVASDLEKQLSGVLSILDELGLPRHEWPRRIAAAVLDVLRPSQNVPTTSHTLAPKSPAESPKATRPRAERRKAG